MGISDDITPKRSYRRVQSHSSYTPKEDDVAEATDFVKIKREENPPKLEASKIFSDASDDFFANDRRKEKIEDNNKDKDKKTAKKNNHLSSWIIAVFLVCLSVFLAINNFQKIKRLFKLDNIINTTSITEQTTEKLDTYVSEIKPQDYTDSTSVETNTSDTATDTTKTVTAFDKTSLKIQVLNGNGVTNSASLIKKTLETAGFKVYSTGNASNFAYVKTFVYYKTGKEEGANLIKDTLKDKVVTVEKSDTKAKTYDIVVVVGKQ